jgi:flavin reductase (DIM6/NTAB) family NADH-FMN oxidoreductase RutF
MTDAAQQFAFRRAMGAFATGVTVVSAADAAGRVCGITVNSITSVSLNPLLILWCLGDQSERYAHFANAKDWGVTVLGADDEALAKRFARAEAEEFSADEAELFEGAPVLKGVGLAHLSCRTEDARSAGDHLVIVGAVKAFRAEPGDGLLFFRGRYGRAGLGSD